MIKVIKDGNRLGGTVAYVCIASLLTSLTHLIAKFSSIRLLLSLRFFHHIHRLRLRCYCLGYSLKVDLKYKHLSRLRLEETIEQILESAKCRSM